MSVEPTATAADRSSTRSDPLSPLSVDVRQVPWIRPLAGDYAFNFNHVAPLYAGDPDIADAWRERDRRAQQHALPRGSRSPRVLAAQQSGAARRRRRSSSAANSARPATVAIVTGQQAGAFGGPLFTL